VAARLLPTPNTGHTTNGKARTRRAWEIGAALYTLAMNPGAATWGMRVWASFRVVSAMSVSTRLISPPVRPRTLSLDLDQRINTRVGHEEMRPVHLQHHTPVLIPSDEAAPFGCACPRPSLSVIRYVRPSTSIPPRVYLRGDA
jgi:hypothetical protein